MITIDLITGFLGSGKTTFIRQYAQYLWNQGEKLCVVENDYGAINVDRLLLSDICREGLDIEMVAGGNDYDCHKRRLKTKLITLVMLGYSRVIVEPSGIFDVDEFFDLMHEDLLEQKYRIGNVIAIARADLPDQLSKEADYLLASQIARAGCVILSHVQECTVEKMTDTVFHMNRSLKRIKCSRSIEEDDVVAKDWKTFTDGDFDRIAHAGRRRASFEKQFSIDHSSFQTLFFMNLQMRKERLFSQIRKLFEDTSAGNVYRIKGFVKDSERENEWLELNATREHIRTQPIPVGQDVIIVIGEELCGARIEEYFASQYSTHRTRLTSRMKYSI